MDSPARSPDNPINLRAVARRVRYDLLRANCVDRFQNISQETLSRCLSDTRDEVLSDDDWLGGDWDLADYYFLNYVGNMSIYPWIATWINLFVGISV